VHKGQAVEPLTCPQVYHEGTAHGHAVTVLISPEPSVEAHSLLSLRPLTVLKEARVGGERPKREARVGLSVQLLGLPFDNS
jgi:hypothetical protein